MGRLVRLKKGRLRLRWRKEIRGKELGEDAKTYRDGVLNNVKEMEFWVNMLWAMSPLRILVWWVLADEWVKWLVFEWWFGPSSPILIMLSDLATSSKPSSSSAIPTKQGSIVSRISAELRGHARHC